MSIEYFFGITVMMQIITEIRTEDLNYPYEKWRYEVLVINANETNAIIMNTMYPLKQMKVCAYHLEDRYKHYNNGKYQLTEQLTNTSSMSILLRYVRRHRHLVFIIHGFLDDGRHSGWASYLGEAIKRQQPGTMVLVIDWSDGSKTLNYRYASASAMEVADKLANFIRQILSARELNVQVHIIGHGLGALIGRRIVGRVPNIHRFTSLDPFGIDFETYRFGNGKAEKTDVIHTDAFVNGFGDPRAFGTVDFYMNNRDRKTKDQPGCKKPAGINVRHLLNRVQHFRFPTVKHQFHQLHRIFHLLRRSLCSHGRAVEYFIEAVMNPSCKFAGKTLEEFGKLRVLGLDTFDTIDRPQSIEIKVYADTNSSYHFCPYAVRPRPLPPPPPAQPWIRVDTNITLRGG
ncbi:pancreatic lipase-related protein 2-like [Planococcus citri]|uniref:pancreatic lipase-related protein 2-like n=1 Tax=Planococcus citri TaxID=170843 RepID=UPI0031F74674